MQAFKRFTGIVVPLDRPNVDTDAIIPKQYLKSVHRTGFGPNLFDHWRYLDPGEPEQDHSKRRINPDFVLNLPRYRGAQVLLTRHNFGCGSSREHAVWALVGYGIRTVIAPSFADIFYDNCFKNGLLPVVLEETLVDDLFDAVDVQEGFRLAVDLEAQQITVPDGTQLDFEIEAFYKHRLLQGLDDIDLTLQHVDEIRAYEKRRRQQTPWLFQS